MAICGVAVGCRSESGTADRLRPIARDLFRRTGLGDSAPGAGHRREIRRDGDEDGDGDGETAMPPKWVRGHCTWRGDHDVCP